VSLQKVVKMAANFTRHYIVSSNYALPNFVT